MLELVVVVALIGYGASRVALAVILRAFSAYPQYPWDRATLLVLTAAAWIGAAERTEEGHLSTTAMFILVGALALALLLSRVDTYLFVETDRAKSEVMNRRK